MAGRGRRTKELATLAATECACEGLRRAARAVSRLYATGLAPFGLTATQFAILVALHLHARVPLTRLAERLILDRTSLYRAIAPLARRRAVQIDAGVTARERAATLTAEGGRLIAVALPAWEATQDRLLQILGNRRWRALQVALQDLVPLVQSIEASAKRRTPRRRGRA